MNHVSTENDCEPRLYQIRVKGHLDPRWTDKFENLSIVHWNDGTTVLSGPVVDQAALHGLLRKVRDLSLPLISVVQVDSKPANRPDSNANTNSNRSQSTMKSNLIRWSGLSAALAGILFIIIQPLHPPETVSSVVTGAWAIVHYLTIAMCVLGLFGVMGIYARQANKAGWHGLAGFLLISLWLVLTTALTFVEAVILPLLTTDAPQFVEGFLGLSGGSGSDMNLGALAGAGLVSGVLYLLGGLLLGIATYRARVLPRRAAGLLAAGAVLSLAAALLPNELGRLAAVPVGLSLAWLGYALWSERR